MMRTTIIGEMTVRRRIGNSSFMVCLLLLAVVALRVRVL
jgi:hypothetical protein